jgi:hypothetical protein
LVGQNGHIGQGVADLKMSALSDRLTVLNRKKERKMDKVEYALRAIQNCVACNGKGNLYWGNGDDFDFEVCECNPYELILDDDGDVIWDNGLLSEPELIKDFFNLSIFASQEAK